MCRKERFEANCHRSRTFSGCDSRIKRAAAVKHLVRGECVTQSCVTHGKWSRWTRAFKSSETGFACSATVWAVECRSKNNERLIIWKQTHPAAAQLFFPMFEDKHFVLSRKGTLWSSVVMLARNAPKEPPKEVHLKQFWWQPSCEHTVYLIKRPALDR